MILIYSHTTSYRLQYICQFIFKDLLGLQYSLTLDQQGFEEYNGVKINYSQLNIDGNNIFTIHNHPLLFGKNITEQKIELFDVGGTKAFFKIDNSNFPFDIFAAAFYLISRYEEYLPHKKDIYGRYAHENSLAFKENFLEQPLVNIWVNQFAIELQKAFPSLQCILPEFKYLPTYDIDIAWSYKSKGIFRNAGGFLKSPGLERIKVLLKIQKDPYDSYEYMDYLHTENQLDPVYFFLVAAKSSRYDKNIDRNSTAMLQLITHHANKYKIGIHPSWRSFNNPSILRDEKNFLQDLVKVPVVNSRQHYIKLTLPDTYEILIDAGIENEYSMGYGSINGFRASVANSFSWFNLKRDRQTKLRVHPFCYMDANSYYEQKLQPKQAAEELSKYFNVCKQVNGTLITIFHNNFLGTDSKMKEWKQMYHSFVSTMDPTEK